MKPVYLEFCGINSFSQKAVIDFQKLLSGGVFGIFGDTGSGKSTILDCIHLALYGKIDRAVGAQNECINYRLDSAYVIFDFEIMHAGKRRSYRVHRERKRKASGNKAHLYEKKGEDWTPVAEGTQEVDDKLGEIIGLEFEDFKKCIALPQGEFAGLVKSSNAERMKLVARLFGLEKYGEKLGKTVRAKCDQTQKEIEVLEGRLQENTDGREENLLQKKAELQAGRLAFEKADKSCAIAQETLEKAERDQAEKLRYEKVCEELSALESQQGYYVVLEQKLQRLAEAKGLIALDTAKQKAAEASKNALEKAAFAERTMQVATTEEREATEALKAGAYEEKLFRIEQGLKTLQSAKEDINLLEAVKEKYAAARKEYASLPDDKRDFDRLLADVEKQLEGLGVAGSLEEYLILHFKGALLEKEYAEVCEDLRALQKEYPVTAPSVEKLLEKYTVEKADGRFDILQARAEYDAIEKKRRQLSERHANLLAERAAQRATEAQKAALTREGVAYKAQIEELNLRLADALKLGDEEGLLKEKERTELQKAQAERVVKAAAEKGATALAEREKQYGLFQAYKSQEEDATKDLAKQLQEGSFANVAQATSLVAEIPDEGAAQEKCRSFFGSLSAKQAQKQALQPAAEIEITAEEVSAKRALFAEEKESREGLIRTIAALEEQLQRLEEAHGRCLSIEAELKEKRRQFDLWDEIRALIKNNQFLDFIASEYLQEICVDASRTLLSLSGGKYFLVYEGEFRIGDNLNGGNMRAVKTLSGGETFLVSLSLALSLSSAICQKSMRPIEFFFLDEGFGTLDEKLIDTVMNVLGKLIGNHFAIGLISHVEELKQRIENKVLVTGATETQSSQVKVIAY
ncbi:MAG: SMC family ATPase [Clostridia bacterium]|nr:SMC family ATPase [Clostridia bacterium]